MDNNNIYLCRKKTEGRFGDIRACFCLRVFAMRCLLDFCLEILGRFKNQEELITGEDRYVGTYTDR